MPFELVAVHQRSEETREFRFVFAPCRSPVLSRERGRHLAVRTRAIAGVLGFRLMPTERRLPAGEHDRRKSCPRNRVMIEVVQTESRVTICRER